ncbi:hypothetical protein EI94DRAFT_1707591 [Lactarius quietus]|nr:hypothetical protein EI94DRAFT_1707591 [Lactarius quietus]
MSKIRCIYHFESGLVSCSLERLTIAEVFRVAAGQRTSYVSFGFSTLHIVTPWVNEDSDACTALIWAVRKGKSLTLPAHHRMDDLESVTVMSTYLSASEAARVVRDRSLPSFQIPWTYFNLALETVWKREQVTLESTPHPPLAEGEEH